MDDKTPQGGLGQSWFVLEFVQDLGEAPKITGGNSPRGTYGPAYPRTEETWEFPGVVELRREVVEPDLFRFTAPGILALQRARTWQFSGVREPAHRIVLARRDDEELLLLL